MIDSKWLSNATLGVACAAVMMSGRAAFADYASTVLSDNPVAYYRFSETSGATAADSANAAGAPQNGAQNGTYGSGVTLDQPGALAGDPSAFFPASGSNRFIDLGNPAALNFSGGVSTKTPVTIEAWIKPDASILNLPNQGFATIVGKGFGTTDNYLRLEGIDGVTYLEMGSYSPDTSAKVAMSPADADKWIYVVGVYNPNWDGLNNGRWEIYRDGVLAGTSGNTNQGFMTASQNWRIGTVANGSRVWAGGIDEVAIYNTSLTSSQIMAHYQAAAVPEPASMALLLGSAAALAGRRR